MRSDCCSPHLSVGSFDLEEGSMEGRDGVEGESEGGGGEGARSLLKANRDGVVALEETA